MAHHGDDVCGGFVSGLDRIPVLFLPYKTYSAGVFRSTQTQIGVILLSTSHKGPR